MGKKLLSLMIAIVMVASLFTGMMVAKAEVPAGYIVYEDYGAGDIGGWTLYKASNCTSCTIQPLEFDTDTDNYAMYYHDVWHGGWGDDKGDYVMHTFNDGAGIPYEEGKNIVIETRTNHMSGSANLSLKFNFSPDTSNEAAWYQHMLWTFFDKSAYFKFGATLYDYDDTTDTVEFANTDFSNTWFTTTVVIKGTSNKADITVKNDTTGEVASVTDLDLTSGANENNIDTTALKNLVFRSTSDTDEILVDYLRIYEVHDTAVASVPEKIYIEGNIPVAFTKATADFVNAVELYDASGSFVIQSEKSFENNTVIIDPNTDLVNGTAYTVKIDKEVLKAINYNLTDVTTAYTVTGTQYAVDEDYGAGDIGGWTLYKASNCTACTIQPLEFDTDTDNYAMYYHDVWHSSWAAEKGDYVMHTFNDGAGIPYEEGKDIVIETRTNHMSGSANLSLKFNFSPDTTNETAFYQHMLWTFFDKGDSSNYFKFGATLYDYDDTTDTVEFADTDFSNKWFTTTVVIKGTSNKADITVKNDTTGEIASITDLDLTSGANEANIDTTALKNLVLRSTKDTDEILVDYLRIYKVAQPTEVTATADSKVRTDGFITVTFSESNDNFKNAISLETADGDTVYATVDGSGTTFTITPDSDLTHGVYYKVVINETVLEELNYNLTSSNELLVEASHYLVEEDYGAGDVGGWTLSKATDCTTCTIEPLKFDESTGNYAMYYHDVWHGSWAAEKGDYVMHTFNDGAGIPYEEGKDIVIETRTNHMAGGANLSLKFNFSPDTSNEAAWYQHMLWTFFDKSAYFKFGATLYDYDDTPETVEFANTDFSNKWFTTTVVIKGTSNKADITVKNDTTGEIASVTDLDLTSGANENNIDRNALKNLVLRSTNDTDEILVDYLRIYKVAQPTEVTATADSKVRTDGFITVTFSESNDNFKNAISLETADGDAVSATVNGSGTTFTITPDSKLTQGTYYKVVIDETVLSGLNYELASSNELLVKASNYIVDDDFGAGDVSGWNHVTNGSGASNTIAAAEITNDSGNYALVYHDNYTQSVATEKGEFVYREIPNGGIAYEEGKNIVIETRTMFTSANSFCSLKLNLPTDINSLENAEAGNCQYSIWTFIGTEAGWFGWGNDPFSKATIPFSGVPFNNRWFTTEIVIKGTTNTADVTVTEDATGLSVTKTDLPLTGPLSTTHLKNVTFRSYNADDDIYVDYLRVYQHVPAAKVTATADSKVNTDGFITVTFSESNDNFKDALSLKTMDGAAVSAEVNGSGTTYTITPGSDLTQGTYYKVVIDETVISGLNYELASSNELLVKASNFIVDEDYSDGNVGGWVLGEEGKGTLGTELIEGSNYAVVFNDNLNSTGQGKVSYYVNRVINGNTGVVFEDGKNVVIETRTRHTATGGGALHFKMNMVPTWTEYGNFQYAIWNMFAKELRYGDVPWSSYTANFEAVEKDDYLTGWFTTTIVIDGTTNKATVTIKEDASGNIDSREVDLNDEDLNPNAATEPFTALKNLSFRSLNQPDTVYIDYLRVYQIKSVDITATVKSTVKLNENILVTFDKVIEDISSAITLKNASDEDVDVDIEKSGNLVKISTAGKLTQGEYYTVVIDKDALEQLGYKLTNSSNKFTVKASNFIVDEDYSDGNVGGWVLGEEGKGTLGTELIEGSNYAVVFNDNLNSTSQSKIPYYINRVINGDTGIVFEDGKDIVIETRTKHTATGGGALNFKMNMVPTWTEYGNFQYAIWNMFAKELRYGDVPWSSYTANFEAVEKDDYLTGWFTTTIVIDGTTNKATVTIKEDASGKIDTKKVDLNDEDLNPNKATEPFTALKNLSFRSCNQPDTVYIDYLRVYEERIIDLYVPETAEKDSNELKVIFNNPKIDSTVTTLVELYEDDGTTKIDTVNTYDNATKTVTLTLANEATFVEDVTYIVKIDKNALLAKDFKVSNIQDSYEIVGSKYIVNDTFDNGLSGWTLYQEGQGHLNYTNDGYMEFAQTTSYSNKHIAIKQFPAPIVHKDGKYTVVETRIKNTSGTTMTSFKVNINPEYNTNWEQLRNNYTLFAINIDGNTKNHSFMYPIGKAENATGNVLLTRMWDIAPDNVAGTWFTVKARFNKINPNAVELTVLNESTQKTQVVTVDMRAWEDANANYSTLNSFAVRMGTGAIDTAYVDYVKVSYEDIPEVENDYEIEIFDTADETKTAVTQLERGKTYTAQYNITGAEPQDIAMILALYSGDELVQLRIDEHFAINHNDRMRETITVPTDGSDYRIKAFLWDRVSTDGLVPFKDCAEASIDKEIARVYVSKTGSDSNDGLTEATAVASVNKAVAKVKSLRNSMGYDTGEILVAPGTYYSADASEPIYISTFHTGNNQTAASNYGPIDNLTIKALDVNDKPVLVNGDEISGFTKVTDESILNRLNHVENANTVKQNLYQYDLKQIYGDVASIPGMDLTGYYSYYEGTEFETADGGTIKVTEESKPAPELFFDGKPLTVARYPNSSYTTLKSTDVISGGAAPYFWKDGTASNYYVQPQNRHNEPMKITNSRAQYWSNAKDAIMFGYWYYDWASQATPISSISGTTITSKYPSAFGIYTEDNVRRYYVYNLLEEIDMPGEYYIDRTTGILYFYMPTGANENSKLVLSKDYIDTVTIYSGAGNVTIDSIDFVGSRASAINIYGSARNITIKNCEISGTAKEAIHSELPNVTIENNVIHDVNGGIYMSSGNVDSLTPGNSIIRNNKISNFARLDKAYTYGISLGGVNNKAYNNELFDAEHTAILFSGVDNEIMYNDIHDVLKEADDAGAIYSGRTWLNRDNKIYNNYIHDISSSITFREGNAGIYLDDHYADGDVQNNIFYNIAGRGVWDNRGRENTINNNIFIDCYFSSSCYGVYSVAQKLGTTKATYQDRYDAIEAKVGTPYAERFKGELYNSDGVTAKDSLWRREGLIFTNNLFLGSGYSYDSTFRSNAYSSTVSGNYYETSSNNASSYVTISNGNITGINNQAIKNKISGFADIDFSQIGVQ